MQNNGGNVKGGPRVCMMSSVISRKEAREKGLTRYFTGKGCLKGHISERSIYNCGCIECQVEWRKSDFGRGYHNLATKKYQKTERGKKVLEDYQSSDDVVARKRAYDREYSKTPEGIASRNKRVLKYQKRRKSEDFIFKLISVCRIRLNKSLKLQGVRRSERTFDLVGCSPIELRSHLQKQFAPGMTFDNYGDWEIDHIIPISNFMLEDPLEQIMCFGYWNLQPLWKDENRDKSDRLDWDRSQYERTLACY